MGDYYLDQAQYQREMLNLARARERRGRRWRRTWMIVLGIVVGIPVALFVFFALAYYFVH